MSDFSGFSNVSVYSLDELVSQDEIELGRGNIISKIDIRNDRGDFPIYSSSAKNKGKMGAYGKYMFDEEMITWSVDGGGSFFYRPKHKFSVTNVSGYMRANAEKLDYKFLHEILDYQHSFLSFDYQFKAHPSVIRELYYIPVPPLLEQKKIASILTSVDEVIDNTQKQIDKLQDLKKATMNELLTKGIGHTQFKDSELGRIPKSWEVVNLGDISTRVTDGTHQTVKTSDCGDIPFLYVSCVRDQKILWDVAARITEDEYSKASQGRQPCVGDILYTAVGSYGHAALVEEDFRFCFQRHIALIQLSDSKAFSHYVETFLVSDMARRQADKLATGNAQLTVTLGELRKLKLPLPQVNEQREICKILQPLGSQIRQIEAKRDKFLSLKKSLMQDLLTGKVRVTI